MDISETLIVSRQDVVQLLTIDECIEGVERAFRIYAEGNALPPKVLAYHTHTGGFHIKTASLGDNPKYFAAKINGNFPANQQVYGLPTIQGVIILCNAINGRVLAVIDSIEITILRTGAATAIATKYLAVENATVATICGCGNQGGISLKAIAKVRPLEKVYLFDVNRSSAERLAKVFEKKLVIVPVTADLLHEALSKSQICITCTPSTEPFVSEADVRDGTFIAAVGADSEQKQELSVGLIAAAKVIADVSEQSATIGEVHHAIKHGLMTGANIHAELGEIIAGKKPGRESEKEKIIFDSTGTALQDVAAASIVYEKALAKNVGIKVRF